MESQELLHPNTDENQNQEVNSGAFMEGQTVENTDANLTTEPVAEPAAEAEIVEPVAEAENPTVEEPAAPEAVAEPAPAPVEEPAAPEVVEEPAPVAETAPQSVSEMMNEIENTQAPENETEEDAEVEPTETMEDVEKEYEGFDFDQTVGELERVTSELDYDSMKMHVSVLKAKGLELLKAARKALYDKFIADGGNKEDFVAEPTELEKKFNAALNSKRNSNVSYKEKRK